jgi:Protein of unknown function (DUF1329)
MHIRKFGFDYSRRVFAEKTAKGILSAGVLAPLWPLIADAADVTKAYPDELLSIDVYTKGKIKTGDTISADNVDVVKDLIDPVAYKQVKEMGRRIKIVASTKDVTRMYPYEYLEATIRNKGKAKLDKDGNVLTQEGKPWIGGNPFPDAKDALEVFSNLVMCWGRHDSSLYAVRDWEIGPDGGLTYQYDFVWVEENTVARVGKDSPYLKGQEDKLRYQSVFFTSPADVKGTAYLNTWHYDQRKFPDLVGYLPAFKRVRKFPTNQRFEPLVAGMALYLSDAWAAGDPMLTWGNYKVVGRGPFLGAVSGTWYGDNSNWERPAHGGPKGQTFFDTEMELCPEVIVIDAEPIGYPRAPVSKKRVWVDVRNMMYVAYVSYDRRGEIFKSFEPQYSLYEKGGARAADGNHTAWSWTAVQCHSIQDNRMSRFVQAKQVAGGFASAYNQGGLYDKYLTEQAIQRLGT